MKNEGFSKINQYPFKLVWKDKIEKKATSPYGCFVAGSTWYWYENFIPLVRQYCEDNNIRYFVDSMNSDEHYTRVKIRQNRHLI